MAIEESTVNRIHMWRSLAAAITAVACLVVTAHPVAAATHDATITGGIITLYKPALVPIDTYDLAPFTPLCASSTLDLDVTTTGTVGVTALSSTTLVSYLGATGNPYRRVVTYIPTGSTYGTLTGTGPYTITNMRVAVSVAYYSSATTCAVTGTPVCTVGLAVELDGTLTGTTVGSSVSLTGAGVGTVVALPSCVGTLSPLVGSTSEVTAPITATLTT